MRYRLCTVADPISRQAEDKRESGFQRTGERGTDGRAYEAAIQAHNQQLLERAGGLFELPLVVLTEQRDHALRRLANANDRAAEQRRRLLAEQDEFITILMTEHDAKLQALRDECERLRAALGATLHARRPEATVPALNDDHHDQTSSRLEALQQALAAADAEIDETRADALRLQEERDDAIRATDDLRLELMSQLEGARDEAFQLETRLDEATRLIEDTRDQARDETLRLSEELVELRREFDACNEEVRRLRARLSSYVVEAGRPPPLPKTHQA
jgi:chromosome segregation ATPase